MPFLLGEQLLPPRPGFLSGFAIGFVRIGRFAGAHESVAGTFVDHRVVSLAGRLHILFRIRNRGVDAGIVAGPVGRSAEAGTNAKLESAIYAYSRSKGLFAGIALDGAVLYMDNDMNKKVYGNSVDAKKILNGNVAMNSTVHPFMDALEKVVPKRRIS